MSLCRPLVESVPFLWDLDTAERCLRTSNLMHNSHYGSPLLGIIEPASISIINCPSEIERSFDSVESPSGLAIIKIKTKNNSPDIGPFVKNSRLE